MSAAALGLALLLAGAAPASPAAAPAAGPLAAAPDTGALGGLPLVEVPARGGAPRAVAVLVTGDGDWADLVQTVAGTLADSGVAVVGVKARAYLTGGARTPDGTAADLARVARTYALRWGGARGGALPVALVGYSRGADLLPVVAQRLPDDVRGRVAAVAMFGLAPAANFTFHWADLVRDTRRADDVPLAPELPRLRAALPRARLVCVYGSDERDSPCQAADPAVLTRVGTRGAHHFDGDYPALARLVLAGLPARGRPGD